MYLLDTNACIRILNNSSKKIVHRVSVENAENLFLSAITKAELIYGARHGMRQAEALRLLDRFFKPFASLSFDDACAAQHARIRAELAPRGQLIGPYDMQIAATALAHDLILVTHNTREFSRVAGLRFEDWE